MENGVKIAKAKSRDNLLEMNALLGELLNLAREE